MPLKTNPTHAERLTLTELEAFAARIKRDENGCWNWSGVVTTTGYGEYWNKRKGIRALVHRFVLELVHKDIRGLIPDHQCENTLCCNPAHMTLGTQAHNVMRGNSPHAINARKTHCKNGHEFTTATLMKRSDGYRECAACRPIYEARRKAKGSDANPNGKEGDK